MKKNFMAIASLLIAAMLLVVSCAPEAKVEGKVEDGLVEAVIGLGRSAKDITITDAYANTHITYYYTMKAAWKSSDTVAPIYGEVTTETKLAETTSFTGTVPEKSLGKVTPGLWNIEVKGYTTTESAEKDKLVLEGKASAYFNGSVTKATVFVSPVSSKETEKIVNVNIKLKMQDLEGTGTANLNQIMYSFTNLNGGAAVADTMSPKDATVTSPANVKEYEATATVRSGFNTVTFSIPGYKGGITKTFLAIPGVTVEITGSVTPAEFVERKAEIVVLNMNSGSIEVEKKSETDPSKTTETYNVGPNKQETVTIYNLDSGVDYKFTYKPADNTDAITLAAQDGYGLTRAYKWYVAGAKYSEALNDGATYTFNESSSGDYNVTCVETITFTKGNGNNAVTHQLQASTTFDGVVRVL